MSRRCRALLSMVAAGALGWMLLPKPPLLDGVSFSREVFDRHGTLMAVTRSSDDKYRLYRPLSEISPALIEATLAREDRYFARHPGCNPVALARSAWRFVGSGEARYGASTITMQLARLRFRLHTRTIPGKLLQIYHALALERHYSKDQILEAYFNLAPYGGNLEGAGAASLAVFRKPASALSGYEALALSAIPQSPARRAPRRSGPNPALQREMAAVNGENAAAFQVLLRGIPPPLAPHFVRGQLQTTRSRVVRTSLDLPLQQLIEERTSNWLASRRELGLRNAAVLLLDWRTSEVLAHVGSADFHSVSICGQVDGTRARRSPGSTLKPFVYALALDQGVIHPDSIVLDAPRSFAGYNPENSDREFAGPIRASEALLRSRNVPAVTLTRELRTPSLYGLLAAGGVHLPHGEAWYGLSLTLGGAEVRMTELAHLYAMLANDGRMGERRLLSPEAVFLVREMLAEVPPPEGHGVRAPVFWKTGTSHGYRDAWSVGICGPYVLAVWLGNFDGRGNPALTGRSAAAPLFFQILERLESRGLLPAEDHVPPAGSNLRRVELCTASGQLPGPYCPRCRAGWFVPGVSSISTCALHREVLVDAESGLRLREDDGSRPVRREVFEFWPADIQKHFADAGLPRRTPPPFAPDQAGVVNAVGKLEVRSPRPGAVLSRRGDESIGREVPLRVNADANTRRVFWFDGRKFLGASSPDAPVWWSPSVGSHHLIVVDQDGRQGQAAVRVELTVASR